MITPEIAHGITVLHRADGHLRFRLPRALVREPAAAHIERALLRLVGVRRAAVDRAHGKLAVHYDAHALAAGDIARALLAAAQDAAMSPPAAGGGAAPVARSQPGRAAGWLHRRLQAAHQRYLAAASRARTLWRAAHTELARRSPVARALLPQRSNERTLHNLLNDITAFYLIRAHWNLITQRWLRAPFAHRYEWLTLGYLTYLFLRFRKHAQQGE